MAAPPTGYDYPPVDDAYSSRSGKFRHIFGEPIKKTAWEDLRAPMTSGEGNYMAANRKFIAYAGTGGGGPVYVLRSDQPGRAMRDKPGINVHKGKVWDWEFYPFANNIIASGGDDCKAALTVFPEDGLTETISAANQIFEGHTKKVTHVRFGKTTDVLATGSFDGTCRLYKVEDGSCVGSYAGKGQVHSLQFNANGSLLAMANKDKKVYTMDPRKTDAAMSFDGFTGSKSVKLQFLSSMGWILATGFDKTAKRQIKIWDLRDTSKTIYSQNLDSASSVLMPHFDDDLNVLYTVGKGEGTISYYEVCNDATKLYFLSSYRNTTQQRGGAWMPKAACDVWSCETQRFYKLTKDSILPLRFTVPRKAGADIFQEDIYPDCFSHKKALQFDDWFGGRDAEQMTMKMDPALRTDEDDGSGSLTLTKKKTYEQLQTELNEYKKKYAALKARLAEADSSYVPSDDEKSGE